MTTTNKNTQQKNRVLLAVLLAFIVLLFAVTIVRVQQGG
jgi:cell division protein FtsB